MSDQDQPVRRIVPWPLNLTGRYRFPGFTLGLYAGVLIATGLGLAGAYSPEMEPPFWATREQILSLAIAYPVLIGYLTGMVVFAHLRSRQRLDQITPIVKPDGASLLVQFGTVTRNSMWIATGVGFLVATMNIDYVTILGLREEGSAGPVDYGMALASMTIWVLAVRYSYFMLQTARMFGRLGEHHTQIDLYRPLSRRPFAQAGILYLLVVMGALALTPLQALDAQLRIDNYAWAFAIGIPTAAALPMLAMRGVHNATAAAKKAELARLDAEIASASRSHERDALTHFNNLIDRREYIEDQHAWPMDIKSVSRAAFYIVIPPLAWVGAALVEMAVDAFVNS